MKNGNDLLTLLEYFNRDFPRPGISALTVAEKYEIRKEWPGTWPSNESPGVYVLLNGDGNIQYIGKSTNCIGSRLNSYFHYGPKKECVAYHDSLKEIRQIWTIPVPRAHAFEASAIEEFLIARLNAVASCPARKI